MKKRLFYLFQSLFAITLFLGYSVTVNAATYEMDYSYSQQYWDNYGSSVTQINTSWSDSFNSYISSDITTVAGSYGAGVSFTSPIPIIKNHTYTISLAFYDTHNVALSSKNHIAISTSLTGAGSNYANNNYYVDMVQSNVSNSSILQFVFTANGGGSYIFIPWTTTTNITQSYVFLEISMEDLGSEGISQDEINNSLTNQTNEINTSIQESTDTITGEIDDMEQAIIDSNKETQDVIKDQFNSCRDSYNLYNYKDTYQITSGIIVDNDGWITVSYDNTDGTSTKYFNYFTNPSFNLKINTKYKLITEIKEVSGTGILFSASSATASQITNGAGYSLDTLSNNIIKEANINTKSDFASTTTMLRTFVQFRSGESGTITFRLSLIDDDKIFNNYEPYGEEICSNKLDEAEETRKGIWETIKNLPNAFMDMLKGLFIPSEEELQLLIDDFKSTMETKLGAIYQVTDMLIEVFKSIFSPTDRNSCITFPEIKDPMFDKLIVEQTDYCFDSLRTDFSFLFTISDMIISIVCTLSFSNMLYKKFEGFIGGDTSDY